MSLPRKFWVILRRALLSSLQHNCLGLAKSAAYSGLLSFFPLLTTLTAMLVRANADSVAGTLTRLLFVVVPPGTEEIIRYTFAERGEQPVSLPIVATILSVWGASGVMTSLMQGFRAAYGAKPGDRTWSLRPFLKERGMAILLVFAAAVPIVTACALIVFGSKTEEFVLKQLGVVQHGEVLRGGIEFFGQFIRYAVAIASIVLGAWFLYYLGPNSKKRARSVWPGAILATMLWWLATAGFAYYVRNIANYNVLYGSIGAVVALIVWMYLLSVIALLGCEYNAQRERLERGE